MHFLSLLPLPVQSLLVTNAHFEMAISGNRAPLNPVFFTDLKKNPKYSKKSYWVILWCPNHLNCGGPFWAKSRNTRKYIYYLSSVIAVYVEVYFDWTTYVYFVIINFCRNKYMRLVFLQIIWSSKSRNKNTSSPVVEMGEVYIRRTKSHVAKLAELRKKRSICKYKTW